MSTRQLEPKDFTPVMGAYSHGMKVAISDTDLIFVTGQIALDRNGDVVSENVVEQAEFVFQNIEKILAEGGADFSSVVKVQIFLTDINDFKLVSPVRNKYLECSKPVSTLVEVTALVVAGCKIEVEVIAANKRPKGRT